MKKQVRAANGHDRPDRRLTKSSVPALAGLILLLLTDGTGLVRLALAASLVHEAGHAAVYMAQTRRLPPLRLSLAGIGLAADTAALSRWGETVLLAAGPAANFICCGVLWLLVQRRAGFGRYFFLAANLCVGCYNLLPFGGLDGARLARLWCPPGAQRALRVVQLAVCAAALCGVGRAMRTGGMPLWLGCASMLALAALAGEGAREE